MPSAIRDRGKSPEIGPDHKGFTPTQNQRIIVAACAACNVRQQGIAAYLGISPMTLRKYFPEEIQSGFERFEAHLTGMLSAKALQGNMTAIIFLLKTKFGWHETRAKDAGTITIDQLSDEAQAQIVAALRESISASKAGSETGGKKPTNLVATARTPNGSY